MKSIRITIVGGGFGGVYVLKKLHKIFHQDRRVEITLISEKNYFLFTPLLHEVATGSINPINIIEPIRKILGCCLHTFHVGKVTKVNLDRHTLDTTAGSWTYDYLILAPGAETNFYDILGSKENSFTLKSLEDAIKLKNHCINIIDQASFIIDETERKKMLQFVVIGGGPTGVELASELEEFLKETFSHYYPKKIINDISIVIVQRSKEILSQFPKPLQEKSLKIIEKKGVKVLLNSVVKKVTADTVELEDGRILETKTVVWVAGVKPSEILFEEMVALEPNGKMKVNEYLQLEKYPFVYAIGDIAGAKNKDGTFIPMLAQVAIGEAETVAGNIKNQIDEQALKSFTYHSNGVLVSLGKWMAVGQIFNFNLSGHFAWWVWRTIYLSKLISWHKKVKVAVDWTINLFSSRDISQF